MAEMSMVEKVGMALHDEWFGVGNWSSLTDHQRKRWVYMARAAIEAMNDPSNAMIDAALKFDWECDGDERAAVVNVWHAMAAAALSEEVAG